MVILETMPILLLFKLTERILSIHWLLGTLRLKKYLHGMRRKVLCKYKSTQSEKYLSSFPEKTRPLISNQLSQLVKITCLNNTYSHCYRAAPWIEIEMFYYRITEARYQKFYLKVGKSNSLKWCYIPASYSTILYFLSFILF